MSIAARGTAAGDQAPNAAQVELAERLRSRCEEIRRSATSRVRGIEQPPEPVAPEYVAGLEAAISAAVEYGIAAIAAVRPPEPPPVLISQARMAARSGVALETILRRYLSGFTLFGEFLFEEAASDERLQGDVLRTALRGLAVLFDRLIATIAEEFARERDRHAREPDGRRRQCVEALLAGELTDASLLSYELASFHLAVVASAPIVSPVLKELARALDANLLQLDRGNGVVWAWLGRRHEAVDPVAAESHLSSRGMPGLRVAFGEPAAGREGWRLSHRQARVAWPVALRGQATCVRYADVALPAAVLQDGILAASLQSLYLQPLASDRDNGKTLFETLRAYLDADRNATSAAAALGVTRQTVVNRLRSAERRLGRQLDDCAADLDVALSFADLCGDAVGGLPLYTSLKAPGEIPQTPARPE
jgi:hypothetical protein